MPKSICTLLLLLFGLFYVAACADNYENGIVQDGLGCEVGKGELSTKLIDIPSSLSRVVTNGAFDIVIKHRKTGRLKVVAQESLLDNLLVDVRGDRLVVLMQKCYSSLKPVRVTITLPRVAMYDSQGSGDTHILHIDEERFKLSMKGSGDVTLAGRANLLHTSLTGSGSAFLTNLPVNKGSLLLRGSGEIHAQVFDEANVKIIGSGNIYLSGKPRVKRSYNGNGRVIGGR